VNPGGVWGIISITRTRTRTIKESTLKRELQQDIPGVGIHVSACFLLTVQEQLPYFRDLNPADAGQARGCNFQAKRLTVN
jgi:hypothetical protein